MSMTYIPGLSVDWIFWEAQTKMIASDFAAIPYVSSVLASWKSEQEVKKWEFTQIEIQLMDCLNSKDLYS